MPRRIYHRFLNQRWQIWQQPILLFLSPGFVMIFPSYVWMSQNHRRKILLLPSLVGYGQVVQFQNESVCTNLVLLIDRFKLDPKNDRINSNFTIPKF